VSFKQDEQTAVFDISFDIKFAVLKGFEVNENELERRGASL
jgi:hypothetical protein